MHAYNTSKKRLLSSCVLPTCMGAFVSELLLQLVLSSSGRVTFNAHARTDPMYMLD